MQGISSQFGRKLTLTLRLKINKVSPLTINNSPFKFEEIGKTGLYCTQKVSQAKVALDLWLHDPKSTGFLLWS